MARISLPSSGGGGGGAGVEVWDVAKAYKEKAVVAHGNHLFTADSDVEPGRAAPGTSPETTKAAVVKAGAANTVVQTYGIGGANGTSNQPFTPTSTFTVKKLRYRTVSDIGGGNTVSGLELRIGSTPGAADIASHAGTLSHADRDSNGWVTATLDAPVTLTAGTTYHFNTRSTNGQVMWQVPDSVTGMTLGTWNGSRAGQAYNVYSQTGAATPFELVEVATVPWTQRVTGGFRDAGTYDPLKPYSKFDLVQYKDAIYLATDAVPVGLLPNTANANHVEVRTTTGTAPMGTLGQNWHGQAWQNTTGAPVTIGIIRGYVSSNSVNQTNVAAGLSLGVGSGTFAWVAKSVPRTVSTTAGGYVDFVLPTPYTVPVNGKVWVAFENLLNIGYTNAGPTGPGTWNPGTDVIRYGTDLSTAWTSFNLTMQLRSPEVVQKWKLLGGQTLAQDIDNVATLPDVQTFIVGSDRMQRDTTAPSKDRKMFFNKLNGSFRAGAFENDHADQSQVGNFSAALGRNNKSSGLNAFTMGEGNVASGTSGIAMGTSSQASGSAAVAIGSGSVASGAASVALGGSSEAKAQYTFASGFDCKALANNSIAQGTYAVAERWGSRVFSSGGFNGKRGDAQIGDMLLRGYTNSATPQELTSDYNASINYNVENSNFFLLPVATSYGYTVHAEVTVVAKRVDIQDGNAVWKWEGAIGRGTGTGNAVILGTPEEKAWGNAGSDNWNCTFAIVGGTTHNRLAVTVTGEAGKNIKWVASIKWTEVHA